MSIFRAFALTALGFAIGLAQQTPPAPEQNTAEMVSHDTPATFRTKVNLVLVPVIVRDSKGKAIGDLKREDFQLFDKGKPQVITKFSVEKAGSKPLVIEDTSGAPILPGEPAAPAGPAPVIAERYTAYVFDDIHLKFGDLAYARDAADRHLMTALQPTDRAAIYTASGQTMLDFTDDREKLHETLMRLQPRPGSRPGQNCPPVTYFMGDLIQNKNDAQALNAATMDAMVCLHLDSTMIAIARQAAQSAASMAISEGDSETRLAIGILKNSIRRTSAMPGQRAIVLVSPGFITPYLHTEVTETIDAAIRAGVTISTLDARGLYTTGTVADASERTLDSTASSIKMMIDRQGAMAESDVLGELAEGTGGTYYRNSNDMNEGFKRTAAQPEYSYLLGFSPQNLKLDGSFHGLKVTVKNPPHLALQARRGYYAPKHLADPAEEAKREVEEALFSREILHDIPVELHTQFFKSGEFDAKLSVLTRVDVRQLRFRKVDGRNADDLTVVCGLFDRNGNYITGIVKKLEMKLKDATLESKLAGGITVKTVFDVKTGTYVIRLVVRDAEGQLMAAQNGSIEIP